MKVSNQLSYRFKAKKTLRKQSETGASENICKLPVRELEQNTWSVISVLYNHTIEESMAIKWKLDEIKAKQTHRRTRANSQLES